MKVPLGISLMAVLIRLPLKASSKGFLEGIPSKGGFPERLPLQSSDKAELRV